MSAQTPAKPEGPPPNVPLIHRPGDEAPHDVLARPPLRERKHLLVVDDEAPVLNLVARALATDNYDIRTAASGAEALALLDTPGAPGVDLLVTDLMMPGMTGVQLAAKVRERCASVRVLYVTGFADNLFTGVQELGDGESFIEKPFGIDMLLEATRLLMFGHISDCPPPDDRRDNPGEFEDRRLRARLVRFLKRIKIA